MSEQADVTSTHEENRSRSEGFAVRGADVDVRDDVRDVDGIDDDADVEVSVTDAPEPARLVLWARDLEVPGTRGAAVTGLDVDLVEGGMCVLQGPDNAGKTSALLTLAGRMSFRRGQVEVDGLALPRRRGAVQKRVSLAAMPGINDLDDTLTVSAHIAERLSTRTLMPWARRRDIDAQMDLYTSALVAARRHRPQVVPRTLVGADWYVGDLTGIERELLGVVLALVGDPSVVVVDESGDLRSRDDRRALAAGIGYLIRTSDHPFGVLTASTEPVEPARLAEVTGLAPEAISVVGLGRDGRAAAASAPHTVVPDRSSNGDSRKVTS